MHQFIVEQVIDSLINGQFKQAKLQTLYQCRTKPERLAYRVGQVITALVEHDLRTGSNLDARYLELFNPN